MSDFFLITKGCNILSDSIVKFLFTEHCTIAIEIYHYMDKMSWHSYLNQLLLTLADVICKTNPQTFEDCVFFYH